VRNSGVALLTIINNILDFSKVEAGKLILEQIEFCPRTVVDGVVDLLAGVAQAKGLELVAVVDHSVPEIVRGDPGRLRQVLTNLIGNANKFTQAGEIVIRARLGEVAGEGAVIHFEVCDTGDGIAADDLATIFQPFVQADTSSSRMYGGTGLGLAISGQLVGLMGGGCAVTSRLGVGSTFSFTICVHCKADQPEDALLAIDAELAGVGAVIVDDNATLRAVLGDYLTGWGMRVSAFESGSAALAALRSTISADGYAVAIIDREMPEMDGLELMDAIVADPSLDLGLVLTTNLGEEDELGGLARFSRCASLTKPIHPDQLQACLRRVLGLQGAEADRTEPVASPPSASGRPAVRLLLAEDNLINQQVAIAMLAGGGYHVDTVPDGAAAVRAVADGRYDAVLMDCQMPKLSGYEATAAIRAGERPGQHVPIIAMTAGARAEDRERCLTAGMDSYLSKPVSKDALLAVVASAVNGAAGPARQRAPGATQTRADTRSG
jgi:CheY-like chemotaxis protein